MADAPADVFVVLNAIAKEAAQLCDAPFARVTVVQGDVLHPLAGYARDGTPRPPAKDVPLSRTSIQGRALLERKTLHFADIVPLLDDEFPDARENARVMGFRAVLAVPLVRGDEGIGAMFLYRSEPGLFAPDQVALVETFARQAAIALHSVRQFHATAEALEQQTATSEILRVISRSRTDVKPVFETIAQAALKLCGATSSTVHTYDGTLLHIGALASTTPEGAEAIRAVFPRPAGRDNGVTRAVFTRDLVQIPDILQDADYATTEHAMAASFRSVLAVPLMHEGEPIGAISLGRPEPGLFPASQVALLQTFADQAVIAIQNVRLFTALGERNAALSESLEQRTATSDILAVISRSPTDVQPVFDTIAESALRLCGGIFSAVYRFDGELIHVGALRNISPEGDVAFQRAYPCKPNRNGTTQRAILTGELVHMPDVRLDPEYGYHDIAAAAGFRSVLSVPMLRDGKPIGTITVYREVAGEFPEAKIALLQTFADQAVIAIQNVRLFKELESRNHDLTELLEQQTATSDILQVISQAQTDVQPVFDTIAASVLSLCRARFANVFTYDGRLIHVAAYVNAFPEFIETMQSYYPMPPGRKTAVARAIQTGEVSIIPDVLTDPDYEFPAASAGGGFRSILAVPLMRDGKPVGGLAVGRPEPGQFPDSQIALLKTFADQAVIAIENVRLFTELEARNRDLSEALEQQTATSDILRVISRSQTDVQPVFDTIAAAALTLCRATSALVTRLEGDTVALVASANLTDEGAAAMAEAFPMPVGRGSTSARAILEGRIVVIPDVIKDLDYEVQAQALRAAFRSTLAVPLVREGRPIGTITVGKPEPGRFSDSLVALLQTFADQAVIAIENVRLFNELNSRNSDLTEALEQQTATSDILRVISRSQTDVQPVFDTIAHSITQLCGAHFANVFTYDGALIHLAASVNANTEYVEGLRSFFPRPAGRETGVTRAIATNAVCMIEDVLDDPDYVIATASAVGGFRSVLAVPLLRDGKAIGGLAVGRPEPGPFPATQVALLQTFADQAVIAIENVRLFKELEVRNRDLTEALEQQTATSDILRVISQSQTAVQPVFDTIVRSVLSLCGAAFSGVYLVDEDTLTLAATAGMSPEATAAFSQGYPRKIGNDTVSGRAALECRVVKTDDLLTDPDYAGAPGTFVGARTVLGVPLVRDGRAIGSIGVWRNEVKPFSDTQVALLETFADQAVIAIENVRLFRTLESRNRDLSEALEQQTATSDILRVISQSQTDVQPVFDAIVKSAVQLCEAQHSLIFESDGEALQPVSRYVVSTELNDYWERNPIRPGRGSVAGMASEQRRTVHVDDVLALPDYAHPDAQKIQNYRTVLAVPMLRDRTVIGVIVTWKTRVEPFTDKQVELVETFADQAVIAVENVRLLKELNARTAALTQSVGELKALGEVGQAVSSTLDLGTVLSTIVARARQLSGVESGSIYEYDEVRQEFLLHSADGVPDDLLDALRKTPMRPGEGALGRMAITGQPVEIRDVVDERVYQSRVRDLLVKHGLHSMLVVPLLREDHLLGGLVINRKAPGAFDPQVVELLKTFAAQSAIAIENARLFREIEIKSRELETASRHKSEFLANMSHELRTPLNAIIGFSDVLSERLFGELNTKQAEYVTDIAESGRHLLALINDILDLSKIEAGRMELDVGDVDIPRTIVQTLSLVRERAERRGVALTSTVAGGVGIVHADERKVKQVLLNLLSNALKFTPEGGHIDVRAAAFDDCIEISVTDTGVGIAPEDQEAVFEEFRQVGTSAARAEGTGLGLAISRKFIELHGGRLSLQSVPGKGSTFTFSLPLSRP